MEREHPHCLIHLLWCELAVDMLHGLASLLHSQQGLVVDIGRLNRVDLRFQGLYLRQCLFLRVFVGLFASQGSFRG